MARSWVAGSGCSRVRRIWSQLGARVGLQEAHDERAPGVARLSRGNGLDSRGSGVRESGDVSDDG